MCWILLKEESVQSKQFVGSIDGYVGIGISRVKFKTKMNLFPSSSSSRATLKWEWAR